MSLATTLSALRAGKGKKTEKASSKAIYCSSYNTQIAQGILTDCAFSGLYLKIGRDVRRSCVGHARVLVVDAPELGDLALCNLLRRRC